MTRKPIIGTSHHMSDSVPADVWKNTDVARAFLEARSISLPHRDVQSDIVLRLLHRVPPPLRRALDLGCGNGLLLNIILHEFPDATGVGVDFSPPMLDAARRHLAPLGGRARLMEADLETPSWHETLTDSFEAILSGFAIHHLPDLRKQQLYGEIHDLLTPGGVFVNCEHVASPDPQIEALFDQAHAEHLFAQRRARGDRVAFEQVKQEYLTRPDRAANRLTQVEAQLEWLRSIGYVHVDCYWKWFELAVFGGYRE